MNARRMTRLVLLVQALAALAIGLASWRWGGAPPWLAAILGPGCVVLVRLLINMNNFLLSAFFASPTPPAYRLGPGAFARMLAAEFRASMLATSWLMPRATSCLRVYPDASAVPVLLVHGYGCNGGYWAGLGRRLEGARISHAAVDLVPLAGDIDGYVPLVERAVEELRAATGAGKVAIVAHSMGGLVARAWMRRHGAGRVARLVTLGTPHFGTGLARFGLGVNARQMGRRGEAASSWLQALADSEDSARRALVTSIFSHHDNIVSPQTSSELPGARNIAFGGVGHVALGHDARVLEAVMDELAALGAADPRQASGAASDQASRQAAPPA